MTRPNLEDCAIAAGAGMVVSWCVESFWSMPVFPPGPLRLLLLLPGAAITLALAFGIAILRERREKALELAVEIVDPLVVLDLHVGGIIEVTGANVVLLRAALGALQSEREALEGRMRDYPLIIEFAGYRFVVDKAAELTELTQTLKEKLAIYGAR